MAAVLVVAGVLALCGRGGVSVVDPSAGAAPPWSAVCRRQPPRPDRELLAPCSRVEGRVVVVRHKTVGPHRRETHVAVLASFGVVLVKLAPRMPSPRLGAQIVAVGPLVRARVGLREVQAFRLRD